MYIARICKTAATAMTARCDHRGHHCPSARPIGKANAQMNVAGGPPQNENCARTKPSSVIVGFALLTNAGKKLVTEGSQYSSIPIRATSELVTKKASNRCRQ